MSTQISRTRLLFPSLLAVVFFLFARSLSAQNTIRVPGDQSAIQAAINAAHNGDTVLVAPGTYAENTNFGGKAITVTSSGGPSVTIIDGGAKGSVVTFNTGETASSVLNGFTIQNGRSTSDGGGIYINSTSPTITNNIIQNNTSCGNGSGIAVEFGSPRIQGNTIQYNTTSGCSGGSGAGIWIGGAASAQIIGNVIANNSLGSGDGGGIALFAAGTPTIRNNIIKGNTATGLSPATQGGGIWIVNQSDALIVQNLIYNNTAGQGGGIYFGVPSGDRGPILVNNTIIGGSGGSQGSAVYADGFDNQVRFFNNLLIGLSGQNAVDCDGTYIQQPPTFTNNDAYSPNGTGLTGTCAGQANQNGNISVDPQFVNASTEDFHLQSISPAVDAGDNAAISVPLTDYAGNPRILDGNNDCLSTVDMGVYELVQTANASLSPSALSFPSQVIGSSSSAQSVTLTNTGATCFQFSQVQIAGDFSQANNCAAAGVPGGSSCMYSVTFTPTASGSRAGTLTVAGSDGVTKKGLTVSLSGFGLTPPSVSLSPATLSFAPQPVGTTSAAQTITLTNRGNAALAISGINVTGPFSQTSNCPSSLAGGAACTISIAFTPTASGTQSGTLNITDNASGSPQTAGLSGTGADFSVSANPTAATVKHGQSVNFSIGLNPVGGAFNAAVTLSCSGLPNSTTCSFSPSSATPGSGGANSVLTLSTSGRTPKGTFNITVVGQSGSLQHSAMVRVTVN